jgi:hypothetical protein
MGVIYKPTREQFRVLYSEKTVYPVLRFLARGVKGDDIQAGELVGIKPSAGLQVVAEKITAANQYAQAKHAAMRVNTTTQDVLQSGGVTVNEGFYLLRTEVYLPGSYAVGDKITLRYDATNDRGVFGPVDGSTTDVIAHVQVAPQNGSENTPMILKVYSNPVPKV